MVNYAPAARGFWIILGGGACSPHLEEREGVLSLIATPVWQSIILPQQVYFNMTNHPTYCTSVEAAIDLTITPT